MIGGLGSGGHMWMGSALCGRPHRK